MMQVKLFKYTYKQLFITFLFFFLSTQFTQAQSWTQLIPSGSVPTTRRGHTAVYDSTNNKMIIFGGYNDGSYYNDVWVLNNANGFDGTPYWTQLTTTGDIPPVRLNHTAVYDSVNNRMIIFGGYNGTQCVNDTWVLSHANGLGGTPTWIQLTTSGTIAGKRDSHTAVYDSTNNKMIIYGGEAGPPNYTILNIPWILSNANGLGGTPYWAQITTIGTSPVGRAYHTAVYDESNKLMTIFGGAGASILNDTWVLKLNGTPSWTQLTPIGNPGGRSFPTSGYDTVNNRMIIYGGIDSTNINYLNDIWVLSNANGKDGTPNWTQLYPLGNPPTKRFAPSVIYDNTNKRMIVFAGSSVYASNISYNDVWILDNANGLHTHPRYPNAPSLKLFIGQSFSTAFNLEDYNTGDVASTYSILSNFQNLSFLQDSTVSQGNYDFPTSGSNIYMGYNSYGDGTATNQVKYSTYKIMKLPQLVMHPGGTWDVNVGNYTIDSSNNKVIPSSFNQSHCCPR